MEGFCRACLNKFNEPTELLQYCESNRRLFVYCTGLQVKRNDTFTFQLCKECYLNLKFACKFKKQCRTSDKKFKSYLSLKRDGENIEFSNYLKNIEDTLTLRLPIGSSSSTPAYQNNYNDDDNESTCTSIQNFMSDMLQGEEMLPTEARIIREVIQEEADIMDDSLDSHWLQDDGSIDNDLAMDFNFAGFSTPHSINNDHCYTPRRSTNAKEDNTYYYTPKDALKLEETQLTYDHKDMPLLEIAENINTDHSDSPYDLNNIKELDKQAIITSNQNDMPLLDDSDIKIDGIIEDYITMENLQIEFHNGCTEKPKNEHITVILNKGVASKVINSPLTNELEFYMNKVELNKTSCKASDGHKIKSQNNEQNIDTVLNQFQIDTVNKSLLAQDFDQYIDSSKLNLSQDKNIESPVKFELDQYINKAELKKKLNKSSNRKKDNENYKEKCSIDRNLEIALRNDDSQEFSLDQLLISPQVSIRSAASTPTINNILFGNLTPKDTGTVVTELRDIATFKEKPNPTDFIEDFFKDDCQYQSLPKKQSKEVKRRYITVKDINKLKESKVKTQRRIIKGELNGWKELTKSRYKKQNKRNRGYKDIKRLKDLLKSENKMYSETSDSEQPKTKLNDHKQAFQFVDVNHCETSHIEMLDDEKSDQITEPINNKDAIEYKNENHSETTANETLDSETSDNETLDSEILDSEQSLQKTEPFKNNEPISQTPQNTDDDLDISISNLLKFDDNISIDLNMSIASDFLKDETLEEDNNDNALKNPEYHFKMPFSPPDKKYDLDKNLCKICVKTYKSKAGLRLHFIKIHKQQLPRVKKIREIVPKICPKCGKSFRDPSSFHKHIKKHEEPDNFKCEYCTLEFPSRGRFHVHITRTHASEIALKEKKNLATNEQDKDGNNESKEQSEEEGKTEEDINDNDKSNGMSEEEGKKKKAFICPTCGKVLTTSGNFYVHIRRHNKTYTVKCEICDKGFIRKYDLNVHKATHNKDYPFECQYCPKKYRSRHLLVGHMYRHLGKEKFKCEVCDRHFVSDQYLKQHYKTEMCAINRKALESKKEISNITVTYKPYVHKQTKDSEDNTECPENVNEGGSIDTNEIKMDCSRLVQDEITKSASR